MDTQPQNNMNDDATANAALQQVKASLQREMGKDLEVVKLVELNPILAEVVLGDPTSGTRYFARCYRVPAAKHSEVYQLWREHAATLNASFKYLPQKAQGLKNIGNCLVYLAAEVPGIDLQQYLRLTGPLRPELAVRICVHLIRSLEKLAEFNCHHLRIHPANVTITPEGIPVLRWIGLEPFERALANFLDVGELGDISYASPEQLNEGPPNASTDIYQLGLLLYRMVAGCPPYRGSYASVKEGHLTRPLPNPQAKNSAVATGFNHVLIKALAKEPAQRFANLQEFRTALAYLQPSVERAESIGATDARALKLKDKDKAKITQLLTEAQEQLDSGDMQTALRTIDNVFVMVGWHGEAARMHQQIWENMYGATVKKFYDASAHSWSTGNAADALARLQNCLAFMPRYKAALKLQADIFKALPSANTVVPGAIDAKAYLGKAVEIKSEYPSLAQSLWTQVLMLPLPEEVKARSDLQFQKQLAMRGLKGLPAEPVEVVESRSPEVARPSAASTPESAIEIEDGAEDYLEAPQADAVSAPAAPTGVPPLLVTAQVSDPELKTISDDMELNLPLDVEAPSAAKPKAKKGLKLMVIAAALLLVAAVAFWQVSSSKTRAAAEAAYSEAEDAEHQGEWERALQLWTDAAEKYPNYKGMKQRLADMKKQIYQRKYEIQNRVEAARQQLTLTSAFEPNLDGKSVLDQIAELLRMDSTHPEVIALFEQVRTTELQRANELFEGQQVVEAQANYQRMIKSSERFRDQALEEKLKSFVENRVINPGLEKLTQAIKRQNWLEARKLSDELGEVMTDRSRLDEQWNEVWETYSAQRNAAKESGKLNAELAALNVLVIVRPEDEELHNSRDKLSRDVNLAKINELEANLASAKRKEARETMVSVARQLLELDSKNPSATQALSYVQNEVSREIKTLKTSDPRAALKLYSVLLQLPNSKNYRNEQNELRDHLAQFDSLSANLKRDEGQEYARHKEAINGLLGKFPDLAGDPIYKSLSAMVEQLDSDDQHLQDVLRWEQKSAANASYGAILDYLQKNKSFKFSYGRNKVAELIGRYEGKVNNYEGNVKLVIVKAMNLPLSKSTVFSSVSTHCEFKVGSQTFKSGPAKGENPNFNQICNFTAKTGTPMVFTLVETKGRQTREVGSITLNALPEDQKNLSIKPKEGDWYLIINIARER